MIEVNDTDAGCMLKQFNIEVSGYLNPNKHNFDKDGLMDGVEMGLLVRGTDMIDLEEIYGSDVAILFPIEEIGWWMLDEGSGTTTVDSSYYDNDGELLNFEVGDWKTGKLGDYALEFDGVDEYVRCGKNQVLNFERNQSYSIATWVKTSSANGSILSKMNVSNSYRGYDLFCKSDGVIRAQLINELNTNEIIVDGITQIDDGEWHLIVLTYNGSSTAAGVKIYIDGNLESLTTVSDTLNKTIQTGVNFTIGSRTGGNYFSGQLDDIRIYGTVLTQSDITWLNNSGNGQSLETLKIDTNNTVSPSYYLEIPHIGRVYDANSTLKVESIGTPLGNGDISIKLLKEELNCKIEDTVLIDYSANFDNSSAFTYERFLDLTEYVNNNTIKQFYGKFLLKIQINSTYLFDEFKISDFYILTDTFIQAGPEDTKGWITNPAIKDTDNDGWNDYKEIFVYDTNPISVDMDGDGAWDPIDRDPKRDVMLEISPISASVPTERNLQIATTFSLDSGEDYAIYSLKKSADYYQSSKWHAYFDGTHGSSMELHYYVDINDCKQTQGNSIPFNLQLWHVDRYWGFIKKWDNKLLSADRTYYIQTPGHLTQYTIYDTNYEFKVNVKTIGVEKANTIAIYETNGTVFNGHYQSQEKMNIIQLYVNDSGIGTPFEEGPNVIVIPTNLFTNTIFNAHVQNETLDETPIYSTDEEIFKFISVGREGNIEQACDDVDLVFIRFEISSQDAIKILNLLLTCLVNETTNETAVTYSYVSTKENETSAAMMNLPTSVLGYIPWFCNFSDSPQGSKPKDVEDWFWSTLKKIGKALIGFIITIVMKIIELVKLIIDFIIDIFMEILPILGYILWIIIRTIILIYAYIMFALFLITSILMFVVLASIALVISLISSDPPEIKFMSVKFNFFNDEFYYHSWITMKYLDFFDLEIPVMITEITISGNVLMRTCSDCIFGSDENEVGALKGPHTSSMINSSAISNDLINPISSGTSINSLKTSENSLLLNFKAFSLGFAFASGLVSMSLLILSLVKSKIVNPLIPMALSLLIAFLGGFFLTAITEGKTQRDDYVLSMQLGIGLAFLIGFFEMVTAKRARLLTVDMADKFKDLLLIMNVIKYFIDMFITVGMDPEEETVIHGGIRLIQVIISVIIMSITVFVVVGLLFGKRRPVESEAELGFLGLEVIFLLFGIINFVSALVGLLQ
ncbi:MAG: LamG domain-containing protein [Candidatus Thorarchaeota archaeon]